MATKMWEMDGETLGINHNAGFFSCCTIRLEAILDYFRTRQRLPGHIEAPNLFSYYADASAGDRTKYFFTERPDLEIAWPGADVFTTSAPEEQQFSDYSLLNFAQLAPFLDRYFSPAAPVQAIIDPLHQQLATQYDDFCAIRYRGTDKSLETIAPPYAELALKALQLKNRHPGLRFLVQTDEPAFEKYFARELGATDCYYIRPASSDPLQQISTFLAAMIVLSRCRYIISTSGNGELWLRLFRGHNRGSFQWLSPNPFIYGVKNESYRPDQDYFWLETEPQAPLDLPGGSAAVPASLAA